MKNNNIKMRYFIMLFLLIGLNSFAEERRAIDFSDSMFKNLSSLQQLMLSEFQENYITLEKYYYNMRCDCSEKFSLFFKQENNTLIYLPINSEPIIAYTRLWEYRSSEGKYFRLDYNDNKIKERLTLELATPKERYLLRKKKNQKYYSIERKKKENIPEELPAEFSVFPLMAFSETGLKLEYLLFQKPIYASICTIEDIVIHPSEDDGDLAIITMMATSKSGGDVHYKFVFLRDYFWVLKEVVVTMEEEIRTTSNQYQKLVKGQIPLLKSSVIETQSIDGKKKYNIHEYEITKIIPGSVDLSEFDVAQFLPPQAKIGEITPAYFSWFIITCILLGVLLMILGTYMKLKKT
ncbi:MAG: hypothetical protein LBJ67_14570 [Planctomycetaceae bacterium]|jgi:hypothetical protein|nr:hypothetical protein [Planctomycetaceae bacterium]